MKILCRISIYILTILVKNTTQFYYSDKSERKKNTGENDLFNEVSFLFLGN